jgi:hypothetical protein
LELYLNRVFKAVALFGFAGFLSAYTFASYSARVSDLYKALPSQNVPGADPVAAYNNWYRANLALTPYADRQWGIFLFAFPTAMSLAMILARVFGWLGHLEIGNMVAGVIPAYFAAGPALLLTAVALPLAVPGMLIAASLLALSLRIATSSWSTKLFLSLLLSGAASITVFLALAAGRPRSDAPTAVFLITLEALWGAIFGMWLAVPWHARSGR